MTPRASLLVVDDNEANRDVLSRRLGLKGYNVVVAASGADAVSRVAAEAFDLVLLDVEMPGMSGLDVLSRIRKTHSPTEVPVIMVTARTNGADVVEAFRLGANDYVTKPIDFPVALARIRTHLSHKRAVEDLHESEERYALAMQGANDGLWDWNLITDEVHWSPRWKALIGHEESEIGPRPDEWLTRVHPDDRQQVTDALRAHLAGDGDHYESEHRILHRDGTFRWVLSRGAAIRNAAGVATRLAGSLTDITDAKVSDRLTGLPNRLLFLDLLERAIKRTERRANYTFALLVLGLNRFRMIGDSLGPLTADRFLRAVADRLQASLRRTDAVAPEDEGLTLARMAGDEFTVLVDDITDISDAVRVAERLRRALEQSFNVDGHELFTSATVGIAVSTTGYRTAEEILRDATTALHRAQAESTTSCELFDSAMRDRAVARLRIETELRSAIAEQAFVVHYQPIVALDSGRVAAVEALVRWRHPLRGLVSPTEFIPVAEDTGMIVPLGRLILRESCRQMAQWRRRHGASAPDVVCVNVSSRQFAHHDLAYDVEAILGETGLPAACLKLEITESALIGRVQDAQATLTRLQSIGVGWSLDDFGTGYSSLNVLHQLQIDTLKIDRSFVSRMSAGRHGFEMARAIVSLAHNLSMDVVAEGVESEGQMASLRALGCEYAQGFYVSKPVDAHAADALIASQTRNLAPVLTASSMSSRSGHRDRSRAAGL